MTAPEALPSRRCRVIDPDNAVDEIRAFLEATPPGERAWCEVFYPAPEGVDPGEWELGQGDAFDAIELVDGELVTLPAYVELTKAEGAS